MWNTLVFPFIHPLFIFYCYRIVLIMTMQHIIIPCMFQNELMSLPYLR